MEVLIDLRTPNLTTKDPDGQLRELNSYLFQLQGQLNYALGQLDSGIENAMAANTETSNALANVSKTEKSPTATFNSIKSLIIKSADIVNSYYDQINLKLSGQYVAQSTFGEYKLDTEAVQQQTSEYIATIFNNIQTINSNVEGFENALIDVTAYIKTGLLYYDTDGAPVYGVELGQQTMQDGAQAFKKYTRLIPNRLSFYDSNDVEVAYISDRKLHITQAEIQDLVAINARIDQILMGDYIIAHYKDKHLTIN